MGLFRRKRKTVDMNARSEKLGLRHSDLLVMGQLIEHGADLHRPRHTLYYLYFPDAEGSAAAADSIRELGFRVRVNEPDEQIPQWSLICEHDALVLDPDTVRANSDRFEAIAAANNGDYDGWQAAVTHVDD